MDLVVNYYEGEMRKKDEEIDYWKRKFFVLQSQCVLQKEELDVYRVKLDGLCIQLQENKKLDSYLVKAKFKDSTEDVVVVSTSEENDELKYNTMCEKLKEQIEELKTRCQQESMSQAELKMKCEADFERQLKDCKIQCSEMYEELKRYKMKCDRLDQQNEEFKGRCKELATRVEKQVGLETELTHYKAKYGELYVRFQEGNERVVALESDLKEYTRICSELNEHVESLDGKVKATSDEAGKCIDKLSKEIVQLGDEKRKAEDESEVLKTKLRELEGKTALYLKELDGYKVKKNEKEMDSVEYESKLRNLALATKSYVDELEVYKTALNGLKEQIKVLAEDQKSFSAREKKAEETIAYLQEVIKGLREEKCAQPSADSKLYPAPNADRDEHVSGPTMSTAKQSEPVVNFNRDKENDASLFKMEFANGTNEKINFEIEERERAVFKQDNLEPADIIQIGSNEDDRDVTCDSGSKQGLSISTGKKGEEYGIKCKATDIPLSSAPKRKRLPETVTSPKPNISPPNVCTGDIAVSSKVQTAEHYVATLRRRLVSQRRTCPKKNSQADGASKDENTKSDCLVVAVGSSQDKVGSLATENNDGDKVAEEADSDSSGDNEPLKFYM